MLLNAPEIELPASKEIDMREIRLAFVPHFCQGVLVVLAPSSGQYPASGHRRSRGSDPRSRS